jgi:hypothetical protein
MLIMRWTEVFIQLVRCIARDLEFSV